VRVREWKGDVIFLHEIVAGTADRSYGIQVAKLAGLPKPVVDRARSVLAELEKSGGNNAAAVLDDLPLFSAARRAAVPAAAEPDPALAALLAALDAVDPDDLTPKAALDALYRLKGLRGPRPG